MRVYLSGGISHLTYEDATGWRREVTRELAEVGIKCCDPMRGSELLSNQKDKTRPIESATYPKRYPELSDKALKDRDILDVILSDIVLVNLLGTTLASIGSVYEIAIAHYLKKLVVLVFDVDNVHNHPFIRDSGVIFRTLPDAVHYIKQCGGA